MEQQAEGNSSKDNYLRYTKLEAGKPANFALLEEDPLCYWLVWATGTDNSAKPFRFVSKPSQADIDAELGTDYIQALDFHKVKTRPAVECLTWPVYNWDLNLVQVLEVSHVSLARQVAKYGLNRKYSKNLLSWDFELSKIFGEMVRYELLIVPRDDEEHDDEKMEAAWEKAQKNGFDLQQMVVGGDPFNPAG